MKEIIVTNEFVDEVPGFIKETQVNFTFNGEAGNFNIQNVAGEISYEVSYLVGYAHYNPSIPDYPSYITFSENGVIDYAEFLEAFKTKFGVEIPTV